MSDIARRRLRFGLVSSEFAALRPNEAALADGNRVRITELPAVD
jgi:hypothetical protein